MSEALYTFISAVNNTALVLLAVIILFLCVLIWNGERKLKVLKKKSRDEFIGRMDMYGCSGEYVIDPLSFSSLLIESKVVVDNWGEKLYPFLFGCEAVIEKTENRMIHKKKAVQIGLQLGFIDSKKVHNILSKRKAG